MPERCSIFFGVALFAAKLVPGLAALLGWPTARLGGAAGQLAQGNARRNPQRTASTAAALMIGLALVTLVAVLGAGIRSSFTGAVDKIFVSDYAITAQNNFSPIPPDAAAAAARAPGAEAVASVRAGQALVFGNVENVTAVTPNAGQAIELDWVAGSQDVYSQLGADGAFIDNDFAKNHSLHVGSPIRMTVPSGTAVPLVVKGIFDPPPGGSPFGVVTLSTATFDQNYEQPENLFSFVKMKGGVTDANTAALDDALKDFPNAKAQTRSQFKDNQVSFLNNILNVLYILLALSVIVSLFGIINTLVLTVFERTREIGTLRAVGMTRRQVRRMIRYESIITALIGAALGIALGIVFAGLLDLPGRLHHLLPADRADRHLRDRRDHRRDRRRDPAGPARVEAERPPGAPVRVAAAEGPGPHGRAPLTLAPWKRDDSKRSQTASSRSRPRSSCSRSPSPTSTSPACSGKPSSASGPRISPTRRAS